MSITTDTISKQEYLYLIKNQQVLIVSTTFSLISINYAVIVGVVQLAVQMSNQAGNSSNDPISKQTIFSIRKKKIAERERERKFKVRTLRSTNCRDAQNKNHHVQ